MDTFDNTTTQNANANVDVAASDIDYINSKFETINFERNVSSGADDYFAETPAFHCNNPLST